MTIRIHISKLIKFLSITPDNEGNGAPITLEYEYGMLHLTYKKGGMLIKLPYSLNGADDKWSITIDHTALMDAIAPIKSKEDISLSIVDGDLVILNSEVKVTISPWGKKIVDFDPDQLELDHQVIEFPGKHWMDFVAAARIAKNNKKGVNPEIVGKAIQVQAANGLVSVSAWAETVSTHRVISLANELTESRSFVMPLEAVEVIAAMKSSQITMTLDYKFEQLLIETDMGYVLVDLPQTKYPATDGIEKGGFAETSVGVKRKDLLEAVKAAVEAGAKNITLIFDNETIVVEAAKVKKQEVPAEVDGKRFTASIKVTAGVLLDALKTLSAAKIFLHFPMAAANSLIIDTVTGVMYVFVVTEKAATQFVESAEDVLKKPEPLREVVKSGTNSDGTLFVIEVVEQSPLEEVLSIEEREKKREELAQKYGADKVELAEAVDAVTKLREKVKQIVKDIDSEITQINEQQTNAVKQVNENPNFKDFAQEQDKPLAKYHQQLEELQLLKEKLTQVVTEAENAECTLENYAHVYTLTIEKLKEISLKMLWWGGRTIEFLFKEEKAWCIEMKVTSPRTW